MAGLLSEGTSLIQQFYESLIMGKSQSSTFVLTAIWLGISILPIPKITNQSTIAIAQNPSIKVSWSGIFDWFRRRKTRAGSRNPHFVPLAPVPVEEDSLPALVNNATKVWNQQPMFIWQGEAGRIQVRSKRDYVLLWEASLESGDRWILYQGQSLEAGEEYVWILLTDMTGTTPQILSSAPFEVMTVDERRKIDSDLTKISQKLCGKTTREVSPETLALHRAYYFSQLHLASDALWEVFQLKEPSPELTQLIQSISALPNPVGVIKFKE